MLQRRAVSLGRARDLSASQFIAIVAVVLLHVAIFVLLMSARVPRLDSHTDDTSMTLILIPPVVAPRGGCATRWLRRPGVVERGLPRCSGARGMESSGASLALQETVGVGEMRRERLRRAGSALQDAMRVRRPCSL